MPSVDQVTTKSPLLRLELNVEAFTNGSPKATRQPLEEISPVLSPGIWTDNRYSGPCAGEMRWFYK